jgi:hypothetical protein
MQRFLIGLAVCAVAMSDSVGRAAEQAVRPVASKASAAPATKASHQFRTPWGDPDLQGIWNNSTITPLERPGAVGGREFLTEEEVNAQNTASATRSDARSSTGVADVDLAYNDFWWERGSTVGTKRTSLIIDPPDGRVPALTPEGQRRAEEVARRIRGVASGPEDRNLAERCLTRGAPKLPGGYNNNVHILQTPDHIAILQEMIHETRLIPLDGRPHLSAGISQWVGDSRARWDGSTLVIDTTNYHPDSAFNSYYCCRGAGRTLHIVERYTRVNADTIDFQFTVEDKTTFTRPFTIAVPMTRNDEPMFEYACHEGNYGMTGILSGARAQEKAASTSPTSR